MAMAVESRRVIARALVKAATNRISLSCSGAVVCGSLVFQSSFLCAVAVGSYVTSMVVALSRRKLWRDAAEELRRWPPVLPHPTTFDEIQAREYVVRVANARLARERALEAMYVSAPARAQAIADKAAALEESTLRLAFVLERMGRFLGPDAVTPLRLDLKRLQDKSMSATLPATRIEYHRAVAALGHRLASIERTEAWRGLVQARLEAVVGALEGLPPRLVQLDVWQATAAAMEEVPSVDVFTEEIEAMEDAAASAFPPSDAERRYGSPPPLPSLCAFG
jgi:hypothetical protein